MRSCREAADSKVHGCIILASTTKEIEFVFLESPYEVYDTSDWPELILDVSAVEDLIKPFFLKMFSLIYEESLLNGAEYTYSVQG